MNEVCERRDFWSYDSFVDAVTSALIAMYETKLDPECDNDTHGGLCTLTESDLFRIRRHGLTIPAPDRVFFGDHFDDACGTPSSACISFGSHRPPEPDGVQTYCRIVFCKRLVRFPTGIRRTTPGIPYELINLFPQDHGGVIGLRSHLVLKSDGTARVQGYVWTPSCHYDPECGRREAGLTVALQLQEDLQNQWTVTAETDGTRVTVGAYPESIKSVLYARSLPITSSGRRRPILHLVEAHRRRIARGIEIDIAEFLRGAKLVEMDGIRFRVAPSRKLHGHLGVTRVRYRK